MLDLKLIDQLSILLKDIPRSRESDERSLMAVNQKRALVLLEGLFAGKSHMAEWRHNFKDFCNIRDICGSAVKEDAETDENLLNILLEACDAEILEALVILYGKESKIGKRIKEFYQKKSSNTSELKTEIENGLKENHRSFYQLLVEKISEKGYSSDAEYYKEIHFSRQLFSKLRKPDYTLSKNNVLWLSAGLGLDYWETVQLLAAAGYTFRRDSRRDTIISYVIKNGEYTLDSLNEMLCFFGAEPIGCLE